MKTRKVTNAKTPMIQSKTLFQRPAWVKLGNQHSIKGYSTYYQDAYGGNAKCGN